LQNATFCPISVSGSNFNHRNIQYIPVVDIFAFLELEQKLVFCKGLVGPQPSALISNFDVILMWEGLHWMG